MNSPNYSTANLINYFTMCAIYYGKFSTILQN